MKRSITLLAAGVALLTAAPTASADVKLSGRPDPADPREGHREGAESDSASRSRPTGRARAAGRHVRFPITGGWIDPATAAGRDRPSRRAAPQSAGGTRSC